jgi:hypothetical protein
MWNLLGKNLLAPKNETIKLPQVFFPICDE